MASSQNSPQPTFILTNGGPVDHILTRLRLRSPTRKRVTLFILIAWLPILILSAFQEVAIGQSVRIPFLLDIGEQVRLLLVVPLLLAAEPVIGTSVREAVEQFDQEELIPEEQKPAFHTLIRQVMRWKESAMPEVIILVLILVMTVAHFDTIQKTTASIWLYPTATASSIKLSELFLALSPAGKWLALVAIPIYRFLLLRWIWRFLLCAYFLWQTSRLPLQLIPTHPDRAGGIAFLGDAQLRFTILLFAMSAVMASSMANLIVYDGKSPLEFKLTFFWFIVFVVLIVLLPLFTFMAKLITLKEDGQLQYGELSMTYNRRFEQKWMDSTKPDEALLGNEDIRSLADMNETFSVIRDMTIVPFDFETIKYLVLAAIVPFLPLLLSVIPMKDLWEKTREFLL